MIFVFEMIVSFLIFGLFLAARSSMAVNNLGFQVNISYENPGDYLIEKTNDENLIYVERNAVLGIKCIPNMQKSPYATWTITDLQLAVDGNILNDIKASRLHETSNRTGAVIFQYKVKNVDQVQLSCVYSSSPGINTVTGRPNVLILRTAEEVRTAKVVILNTTDGTVSSSNEEAFVSYMAQVDLECVHNGRPEPKTLEWWVQYPGEGNQWMKTYLEGHKITTDPIIYDGKRIAPVRFKCHVANFVTKDPLKSTPVQIFVNTTGLVISNEYVPNPKYYTKPETKPNDDFTGRNPTRTSLSGLGLNKEQPGDETNMSTVLLAIVISVPVLAIILIAAGVIFGVLLARKRRHPKLPRIPKEEIGPRDRSGRDNSSAPLPLPRPDIQLSEPHTYCDIYETMLSIDNSDDYLMPTVTLDPNKKFNNGNREIITAEVRYSTRQPMTQSKGMYSYADADLLQRNFFNK